MSEKIFLTRNQLAKFLPTPEAIKAFENLFKIATQQTPNNLDEVQISAESALSMANYSLSVLDNVSKLIEALELQPPETPTISEDIIDIPIVNINECECLEIIKEPDWNFIKNHPTTISGYGITDAYTQVVADAPLAGYGTTSSHLSIPAATSLASGYLSSTDWTTFNSKQTAYTNLTNIGSLANSSGWLKNNGSGTFSYSTPTKSDVGLGNVDNTADSSKSVASAATLTTARNINGVSFNGSADITTPINTTQKSDNVEYNLTFVSSVTAGNQSVYTDSAPSITYNPSTNTLTTSNLKGKMTNNDTTMVSTNQTLTNWWGMYLATLGNSPIAGNPSKWIKIDDNGTIRYIPTWS